MYSLPKVQTKEATNLIIIRDNSFRGGGLAMIIIIDKVDAYALPRKSYIKRSLAPGEHTIGARMDGAGVSGQSPVQQHIATVTARPGKTIYLLAEPVGVFIHEGKISQISEARGRELMAESEFLPD
jgi:hypothetical protein